LELYFFHSLLFYEALLVSKQKIVDASYHLLARYITAYFEGEGVQISFYMLFSKNKVLFARGPPSNTVG
jgi:hypothetical protein